MKQAPIILVFLSCLITTVSAQTVQNGMTVEYQGKQDKTPLANVQIMAGGTTAKSSAAGMFKLSFNNLKVGDRVPVNPLTVVNLKDYVLFNKDAVSQWTVTQKGAYFSLVLCKKSTFDSLVKTYYQVSDKAYRDQLHREQAKVKELMAQGKIKQAEYEHRLKEADDRYQNCQKQLQEHAEVMARIDESELTGTDAQALALAKAGKIDEAISLMKKNDKDAELIQHLNQKEAESRRLVSEGQAALQEVQEETNRLIASMKTRIKIYQADGGKENLDSCVSKWKQIVALDTTNLENIADCALFLYKQKN